MYFLNFVYVCMYIYATYSTQCTQLASRLSNITTVTTGQINICSENAVWPPEDGRKDARNMLRNNWLTIKSLIVASSWSHIYLLIREARSLEHKDMNALTMEYDGIFLSPFSEIIILIFPGFVLLSFWKESQWQKDECWSLKEWNWRVKNLCATLSTESVIWIG